MIHFSLPQGHSSQLMPVLPLRVLLIDDSAFDRKWLCRLLNQTGFSIDIVEADNLVAMKVALDLPSFDIVFLDCHLPGSTLEEAVDRLPTGDCAKILITGHDAPCSLPSKGHTLLRKSAISEEILTSYLLRHTMSVLVDSACMENPISASVTSKLRIIH